MSINQKLELSREIRQWIATGLGVGSTIIFAWMVIAPENFERTISKIQAKFKR